MNGGDKGEQPDTYVVSAGLGRSQDGPRYIAGTVLSSCRGSCSTPIVSPFDSQFRNIEDLSTNHKNQPNLLNDAELQ